MSYNTRRSSNYGGPAQRQTPQMTRGLQNNFVSGGQMPQQTPQQQQQPRVVPQQAQQTPQTPVKSILKNNAQVKVEQSTPQYQTYSTQLSQPQAPQQPPQQPIQPQQPVQTPQAVQPQQQALKMDVEMDGEENGEKKRPWKSVKLSKKQRRERRNKRIRKLVRPKSALMVLNELVGPVNFKDPACAQPTLESCPTVELEIAGKNFRASATSKSAAKQKAAEQALKSIIANKIKLQQQKTDAEGDAEMKPVPAAGVTPSGEEEDGEDSSWCQLASFALFKLIDSWQHEGDFMPPHLLTTAEKARKPTAKPAKSLPANAVQLHPLMLFRQMRPDATVEDVGASGVSPNSIYTVKITVDGEEILGTGPNKKAARKNCAQIAMEKLYEIKYPREDFTADLSVAK